jgi:diguanylate cyclase (GGDEF)-like protein
MLPTVPTSIRAVGAVLFVVAILAAALIATSSIERAAANRGYEGTQSAQMLLNAMLNRDTELRGYLQTGNEAFLSGQDAGTGDFQAAVRGAQGYARSSASAEADLAAEVQLAKQWQADAQQAIERVRHGGVHDISLANALARKRLMDAFRAADARYLVVMNAQRIADLDRATTSSTWIIGGLSLLFALTGLGLVRLNGHRERRRQEAIRAAELERDARERAYVEARRHFAEIVQVSETEGEARDLIKRRIETGLPGASVVVLSRNNSADRLEATTPVAPDSPLVDTLEGAKPRSCLSIRLGRVHNEGGEGAERSVACEICGVVPGRSLCEPLLVGGEVIGSLLIAHEGELEDQGRRLISETVTYTAPVLANLRNLAIAERRAHTDSLTGLPNRRALDDTFKLMIAQASRALTPLSVMLIDLDRFKEVNDTFGHDRGDEVLAAVATTLTESVRTSDFAARMGGEEFLVLLPNTDPLTAGTVAENVARSLAATRVNGVDRRVTASFGVAGFPTHGADGPTLLRSADRALYQAKRDGRDCVRVATAPARREEGVVPVAAGVSGESA